MRRIKCVARVSFDLLIFVGLCLSVVALIKWFKPFKRGFFCNDESLQYPFRENTISGTFLIIFVLVVPSSVMVVIELFKQLSPSIIEMKKKLPQHSSKTIWRIGQRLLNCYAQLGYYLFGLVMCLICTQIMKCAVGRLRPHFFAVCQPQLPDGSTCKDSFNFGRYIENYECVAQNISKHVLRQVRQSFPSGHSSLLFYAMVYLAIYLQAALSTRASKLLKHTLQFVLIMLAWYVALTRISDYWHHWSDVVAGILLGSLTAFVVAVYVARLLLRKSTRLNSSIAPKPLAKPITSPTNLSAKSNNSLPILPAYTFGTLPYLPHPAVAAAAAAQQQAQYAQTYHNYGYVP